MTFKITLQFQELDEITVDFIKFTYTLIMNAVGQFSVSFHANTLKYIIPGMYVRIYFYEEPIFSGRLGIMSEETANSVSFGGVDETGILADRLVDYSSAETGSPYEIIELEASEMMQRLLKAYTGKTGTDSRYDLLSYIIPTKTSKKWKFTNTQLHDAIFQLANSSFVGTGAIGFSFWIDGARRIRFAPIRTGTFHKDLVYKIQNITFDNQGVKNDIQFIGGVPDPIPMDRDKFTESTTGWGITYGTGAIIAYDPSLDSPDINTGSTAEGDFAIRIANTVAQQHINFYLDFALLDGYGMNLADQDWSDGEGSIGRAVTPRPQESVAAGNLILDAISFKFRWSTDKHGDVELTRNPVTDCAFPQLSLYLNTNGGATNLTGGTAPTGNHILTKEIKTDEQFITYPNKSWKKLIMYPVSNDGAGIDITDVEGLIFRMTGVTYTMKANTVFLWIDNLAFHFHQVKTRHQNVDSMNVLKSVRSASFSNRDVTNWKTGHAIARGLLERLDDELISGDIEVAFNPNIRINDIIQAKWKDRILKLVVRSITVTSEERMTMIVGTYQAALPGILAAFKAIEVNTQTSSTGYKLQESYSDDRCYTLCEVQCEETCQAASNQTADGVIIAAGGEVKNPCAESCQTYIEL